MLSCHCHSQEQMQVLWDTRNKCLLNIYYEDTFPDGLDGKESACNGGDLGSIPGLGESSMDSGARGHYALVLVSLSWLTLGTVLIILLSGMHIATSAQALASLRSHFGMNHNHHLCSECL